MLTAAAEEDRLDREREAQRLLEVEVEKERLEVEKKKPKISNFDDDVEVGDVITPRPSQYVILKLKNFEFVELWYFSPEGFDDILTMRPVAALRQSRNVINDCDLPISDFFRVKNSFLVHIERASWPKKHINALAEFFWHLENHPICNCRHGDAHLMLLYAHRVRRLWHDDLKRGTAFNISRINDNLMNTLNEDVIDQRRDDVLRKASHPSSSAIKKPTDIISFHK
ncbi:hypothetical protein BU15DRAFT_50162 [Melanogaster broomeanus]|nr:hypothetical protein BU15DRAFT_50162 [Melanogaster broomeanus]